MPAKFGDLLHEELLLGVHDEQGSVPRHVHAGYRLAHHLTKRYSKVADSARNSIYKLQMYKVAPDTDLTGYLAAGYPANSFAGYPAE